MKKIAAIAVSLGFGLMGPLHAQDAGVAMPPVALMAVVPISETSSIRFGAIGNEFNLAAENLQNGGLFTDLVTAALAEGDPNRLFNITYVNPIDTVDALKVVAYPFDVSFPWIMPDCTNLAPLNATDQSLCTDFIASSPYFQVLMGMYAKNDSAFSQATSINDLADARICRPVGHVDFDLTQRGLSAPFIELTRAETLTDCFSGLTDGRFDIVSIDEKSAEQAFAAMEVSSTFIEIDSLTHVLTMHALAPRVNPSSRVNLAIMDAGMRNLAGSGAWFSIVMAHLTAG